MRPRPEGVATGPAGGRSARARRSGPATAAAGVAAGTGAPAFLSALMAKYSSTPPMTRPVKKTMTAHIFGDTFHGDLPYCCSCLDASR